MKRAIVFVVVMFLIWSSLGVAALSNNKISSSSDDEPWIDGPLTGRPGIEYTYCIKNTISVEAESLYAFFEWGDGSDTGWIGPYVPGEDICASHVWTYTGQYLLEIQLKNETGLWIDAWAAIIVMPREKPIYGTFLHRLIEKFPILDRLFSLI